ncbi:phytoene dehydrogenase [Lujinxingia litoralis]|uniref:Phytoene dehydrogenase n=1 Tax=Lujinxingia litoralis TaxID=2211119 RepID=A0A328C7J4_9DELT|nr:FAD-dependent oxidoreductase [Lujinxingia litoralis]RAL20524.1 phytoene dehydrogenase [Lujinxingia litoralis]
MSKKVVILGGGVGGMSAAQELAERGFDVDVYERLEVLGGKARSIPVPDSATGGRKPLPGEHGFRFFPSFYRHIFHTMKRIPFGTNRRGVYDNLVETTHVMAAREGMTEISFPLYVPERLEDWEMLYRLLVKNEANIPRDEMLFFARKVLKFLTASQARRDEEYENITWWDFVEADGKSKEYVDFLAVGLTRDLVAMQAEISSSRTVARIYVQLMLGILQPWLHVDSILNRPTTEAWIDPWEAYLTQLGVTFHRGASLESFDYDPGAGRITGVQIAQGGASYRVEADYFVSALPVEAMAGKVSAEMAARDPMLATLDQLQTGWMNGILFFLRKDLDINHGHILYVDSPWALTSIFSQNFWEDVDLSEYGEGDVQGILSLCISDWNTPGVLYGKPAKECTAEEIKEEVWAQITARLNDTGTIFLDPADIITWFLSPTIEINAGEPTRNTEPLLLNTVGSLRYRPEASTQIENLFLASDYVRTTTDLATMESANEAARRAVNGILGREGWRLGLCRLYELEEPVIFKPARALDALRFKMGLPQLEYL